MSENKKPVYTLAVYRGRPTMFIDGVPSPCYSYSYCGAMEWPGAREIHQKFAAHGCRSFILCVRGGFEGDWSSTPFWTDDNEFPPLCPADAENQTAQARITLEIAPDTMFWVRCNCSPPVRWRKKLPDDLLLNSYGKRYEEPSLASERYNDQVGPFVENMVRFYESQPWADRIAGYLVYPLGEGTTALTCEGFLFDRSPVMQAGFRGYLRAKYGDDAAIRAAWGRDDVSLETVQVPDDREFHAAGEVRNVNFSRPDEQPAPHRLHWPEPHETAAQRDYCLYMRELTKRNFHALMAAIKRAAPSKLAGIDAFKQSMLGWPLIPRWVGDYRNYNGAMHAVSGAFDMAELIDMPELDVVCTPHDYLNRGMGFGFEGEGIGDSITARGKMMLMEEDQRTYSNSEGDKWNFLKNDQEVRAGLWRNFASGLSRGYTNYPMDVCNPSYFMNDAAQETLAARRQIYEASIRWPRRETPCIVMVLDDAGLLEEDFTIGYQYLAVIAQRMYGLSRCGVPFRLHLLDDLRRDDFPKCHKMFLFPNLFKVTPDRLELLRSKVLCNGNVAVFGPASGITDGRTLGAESAAELTGIPLKLVRKESPRMVTVDRFDHPLTAGLAERIDYGDSYAYGPLLVPQEHPDVTRLGGIQWPTANDGPGLVIREFGKGAAGHGRKGKRGRGDYASVFTCAMPLPAELLRRLARYSGTHVYGEGDDLIFADSLTLGIHSMTPGRRTIQLPKASTVWDLIRRKKVGDGLTRITINVNPPQTSLFYLGADPKVAW